MDGDPEYENQSLPSKDVNVGDKQKTSTTSAPNPSTPVILNAGDEYENRIDIEPETQMATSSVHTSTQGQEDRGMQRSLQELVRLITKPCLLH